MTSSKTTSHSSKSILALLKEDHEKIAGLLEKLDSTTESGEKTRTELFKQLATEIRAHSTGEEEVLYPELEAIELTKDITLEAQEEHNVVADLVDQLEVLAVTDEAWGAKLKVLKENLEHHIEEEEGEMFDKIKQVIDREELTEMGAEFKRVKDEVKALQQTIKTEAA